MQTACWGPILGDIGDFSLFLMFLSPGKFFFWFFSECKQHVGDGIPAPSPIFRLFFLFYKVKIVKIVKKVKKSEYQWKNLKKLKVEYDHLYILSHATGYRRVPCDKMYKWSYSTFRLEKTWLGTFKKVLFCRVPGVPGFFWFFFWDWQTNPKKFLL